MGPHEGRRNTFAGRSSFHRPTSPTGPTDIPGHTSNSGRTGRRDGPDNVIGGLTRMVEDKWRGGDD